MKLLFPVALALSLSLVSTGCRKKDAEATREGSAEAAPLSTSIVEVYERGQIAWNVDENGQFLARVQDDAGKNASRKASGTIQWNDDGVFRSSKLEYDEEHEALIATGPAPKADLTEVRYALIYDGEPVQGSLHVPRAGTATLHAEAEAAAKIDVTGVTAPHGGVLQVVGEDRIEIVADDDSDEVRVYLLDASWKVITPGDRQITLAIGGPKPEVLVLVAADGCFVGHWKVSGQPPRVTVMIKRPGATHVAIVGWHAGAKLHVIGPRPKIKVKGVHWGPKAEVKIGGPMVKIDIKEHGHGPKGKVKIKIK